MKSRLAEQARQERLDQERLLTPEQRILAFTNHGRLVAQQFRARAAAIARGPSVEWQKK
jgi:hypothetical protein